MEKAPEKFLKYVILPLFLATILAGVAYSNTRPDFLMHVSFYDVGQGDSIFIKTYMGNQILIDGGPSDKVLANLGDDLPFYDRTIDLIILTHPHADHVSGLVDVLKRYKVKMVLLPEVVFRSPAFDKFLKLVDEKRIPKIYARVGQRIFLDQATVMDIYWPNQKEENKNFSEGFEQSSGALNDTSIVAKLSFGKIKILFTGDASTNVEQTLLPLFNLDSDLLKVGHHGSRFSTSAEFLAEVTPEYAVIEVGDKNKYGHPTSQTIENLNKAGAKIFRTDQNQTVRFTSDGSSLVKK